MSTGDEFQFKCQYCPAAFTKNEHLELHIERHKDRLKCQCNICGKWFVDLSSLGSHQETHMQLMLFYCDICNAQFTDKMKLVSHKLVHTNETTHKLVHTNETTHKLVHTIETDFSCGVCLRNFKTENQLKLHQLYCHQNTHIYQCNFCGKKCRSHDEINDHLKLHSEHFDYKCTICSERFSTQTDLSTHELTHKKLFWCKYCGKGFKYRRAMIRHKYRDLCSSTKVYGRSGGCKIMPIELSSESSTGDDMDAESDSSGTDVYEQSENSSGQIAVQSRPTYMKARTYASPSGSLASNLHVPMDIGPNLNQKSEEHSLKNSGSELSQKCTNQKEAAEQTTMSKVNRPVMFLRFGHLEGQGKSGSGTNAGQNLQRMSFFANSIFTKPSSSIGIKKALNDTPFEIWDTGASKNVHEPLQANNQRMIEYENEITSNFNNSGKINQLPVNLNDFEKLNQPAGTLNDSGRFSQLSGNEFSLPKLSNYAGTDNLLEWPSPQHMTLFELDSSDLSEDNINDSLKFPHKRQSSGNSLNHSRTRKLSGRKKISFSSNTFGTSNENTINESRTTGEKNVENYPKIYTAVAVDKITNSDGQIHNNEIRDQSPIGKKENLVNTRSSSLQLSQVGAKRSWNKANFQKPITYKKQRLQSRKLLKESQRQNRDGVFINAGNKVSFYVGKQFADAFSTGDECSSLPSDFDDRTTVGKASPIDIGDDYSVPSSPDSYMADDSTQGQDEASIGISSSCTENLPESSSTGSFSMSTSVDSVPADSTVNDWDSSFVSIEIGSDFDSEKADASSICMSPQGNESSLTDNCSSIESDIEFSENVAPQKLHTESCRKKKLAWIMRRFKLKLGTKNGKPCITAAKSRRKSKITSRINRKYGQSTPIYKDRIASIIDNVKDKYINTKYKPLKLNSSSGSRSEISSTKSSGSKSEVSSTNSSGSKSESSPTNSSGSRSEIRPTNNLSGSRSEISPTNLSGSRSEIISTKSSESWSEISPTNSSGSRSEISSTKLSTSRSKMSSTKSTLQSSFDSHVDTKGAIYKQSDNGSSEPDEGAKSEISNKQIGKRYSYLDKKKTKSTKKQKVVEKSGVKLKTGRRYDKKSGKNVDRNVPEDDKTGRCPEVDIEIQSAEVGNLSHAAIMINSPPQLTEETDSNEGGLKTKISESCSVTLTEQNLKSTEISFPNNSKLESKQVVERFQELDPALPNRSSLVIDNSSPINSEVSTNSSPLHSDVSVLSSLAISFHSKSSYSSLYIQSPIYKTRYALNQIAQKKMKIASAVSRGRIYGPTCISPIHCKSQHYKTRYAEKNALVKKKRNQPPPSRKKQQIKKGMCDKNKDLGKKVEEKKSSKVVEKTIKSSPHKNKTEKSKTSSVKGSVKQTQTSKEKSGKQTSKEPLKDKLPKNKKNQKNQKADEIDGDSVNTCKFDQSGSSCSNQGDKKHDETIQESVHLNLDKKSSRLTYGIDTNFMIDNLVIEDTINLDDDDEHLPRISAPRDNRSRRYKWRQIRKNYTHLRVKSETSENQSADGAATVVDVESQEGTETNDTECSTVRSAPDMQIKQEEKNDGKRSVEKTTENEENKMDSPLKGNSNEHGLEHSLSKSQKGTDLSPLVSAKNKKGSKKQSVSCNSNGKTSKKTPQSSSQKHLNGGNSGETNLVIKNYGSKVSSKLTSSVTNRKQTKSDRSFTIHVDREVKEKNNTQCKIEVDSTKMSKEKQKYDVINKEDEMKEKKNSLCHNLVCKSTKKKQFSKQPLKSGKLSDKSMVKLSKIDDSKERNSMGQNKISSSKIESPIKQNQIEVQRKTSGEKKCVSTLKDKSDENGPEHSPSIYKKHIKRTDLSPMRTAESKEGSKVIIRNKSSELKRPYESGNSDKLSRIPVVPVAGHSAGKVKSDDNVGNKQDNSVKDRMKSPISETNLTVRPVSAASGAVKRSTLAQSQNVNGGPTRKKKSFSEIMLEMDKALPKVAKPSIYIGKNRMVKSKVVVDKIKL